MELRFLKYISTAFKQNMLTEQQTRDLLTDIATCSIMRLDKNSMDKLWDLMVMIMKYQLYLIKHPKSLYEMTLRHLHGIRKMPLDSKMEDLIDLTKEFIHENWNSHTDSERLTVLKDTKTWFKPFNTKISVLMRMGLQQSDASFIDADNDFFLYYKKNIGDNIYEINLSFPPLQAKDLKNSAIVSTPSCYLLDTLSEQLNIGFETMAPTTSSSNFPTIEQQKGRSTNHITKNKSDIIKSDRSSAQKMMEKLQISELNTQFTNVDDDLTDEAELIKFFEDIKKEF